MTRSLKFISSFNAYRFGGEEFTVRLPNTDEACAIARAEQLPTQIAAATLAHHGRMLNQATISLGLAASPNDGPPATLLRRTDAALLQAKSGGPNRTVVASGLALADGDHSADAARLLRPAR